MLPDNSKYRGLKQRLRDTMLIELEGTLDVDSPDEMTRFDQLLGELLAEQNVTLSRNERQKLFDDLLEEIINATRR